MNPYQWHGGNALWPDTRRILSDEAVAQIAARAAAADRAGEMPAESFELVRKSGYLGAPVPHDFEGKDASIVECCAIQRRLGEADPGLAVALNMHLFSVGIIVEHWMRERDTSWFLLEAIASQNRVVASAFAEPGLGGSLLRSNCIAEPVNKGYVVSGKKVPCSLAEKSDLICLQLQTAEAHGGELLVALIPRRADGIRVQRTWDALGMRASESDTLILESCFVPKELVFHRCRPGFDDDPVFAAGIGWFAASTTATYLGAVRAVLAELCRVLQASKLSYLKASRAQLATFQASVGELTAQALAVESSCFGLATALAQRTVDPRAIVPIALGVKQNAVELCTRVADAAVELAGAGAYAREGRLSRLWRDIQAVRFHPPTRASSRQILGRWAFGLPFTFEVKEREAHD
jgi:alkylation response protein AidB-like acyl-CoA dehydrogenase